MPTRLLPKRAAWLFLLAAACEGQERGPEDRMQPTRIQELPKALREVSGLCFVAADVVACIQDEDGTLFFWDLALGKVRERASFGVAGDYEGIALLGATFWVLRSDGTLLALARKKAKYQVLSEFAAGAGFREYESLCADPASGRLLLAPKTGHTKDGDREIPVFAFDPVRGTFAAAPLFVLSRRAIVAAAARIGARLPTKRTKNGGLEVAFEGVIAELAVHPTRGEIHALCPQDHCVLVLSAQGEVRRVLHFDAALLPQAEAMTFLPSGELVIASEGRDGPARLAVYAAPEGPPTSRPSTTSRPASTGGGR